MWDILLQILGHAGPAGAIGALLFAYIRTQDKTIKDISSQRVADSQLRVADAQAMVDKLINLNNKWNETINAQIEVSEAQKQLLADVKTMLLLDQQRQRR